MGDDHFPQRVSGTAAAQKSDLHGRWVSQRLNPRLSGWNTIHLAFLEVTRCKSIAFNFGMFWHECSIIFRIYSITFNHIQSIHFHGIASWHILTISGFVTSRFQMLPDLQENFRARHGTWHRPRGVESTALEWTAASAAGPKRAKLSPRPHPGAKIRCVFVTIEISIVIIIVIMIVNSDYFCNNNCY